LHFSYAGYDEGPIKSFNESTKNVKFIIANRAETIINGCEKDPEITNVMYYSGDTSQVHRVLDYIQYVPLTLDKIGATEDQRRLIRPAILVYDYRSLPKGPGHYGAYLPKEKNQRSKIILKVCVITQEG